VEHDHQRALDGREEERAEDEAGVERTPLHDLLMYGAPAPRQLIEQAPGPRGSPHVPHGAGEPPGARSVPRPIAIVDIRRFTFAVPQRGQETVRLPKTSSSNWCAHAPQAYS